MSIISTVRMRCGKHPMKEDEAMKRYDMIRNLTTGETHYLMTTYGESRWDAEGRVDSRTVVEELDRETWEELKAEAEFFSELPGLLSEG